MISVKELVKLPESPFIFLFLILAISVHAQRRVPRNACAIEVAAGHSFPDYEKDSDWKGSFYPAGSISVMAQHRISRHWDGGIALGMTGYALVNRNGDNTYVFDFASPHSSLSLRYLRQNKKYRESFIGVSSGVQLGYDGEVFESHETYNVKIESNPIYPFIRPEIGIKNRINHKLKGDRNHLGYEIAAFYRWNLIGLGEATFIDIKQTTVTNPSGSFFGAYFRIVIPSGSKRIKIQDPEPEPIQAIPFKLRSPRNL